jgi:2-phosphosulfolactate phosphatase
VCAFRNAVPQLEDKPRACVSGHELSAMGFEQDVAVASVLDSSSTVPRFNNGAYAAE